MDIKVPRGKYVLAVSGGVDSMVLLDLLSNLPGLELIVAHFDHGIRADSDLDRRFVETAAKKLGLKFEAGRGGRGGGASEDTARRARYAYLEDVRRKHKAEKIITAHHQDDLIETALLNLLRGSGRRGLTAIIDNEKVRRPLIMIPKKEILKYAKANGLDWREDVTNSDGRPLRNHLRLKVLPKLSPEDRRAFLAALEKTAGLNADINREIAALSLKIEQDDSIDRQLFSLLPAKVADELLTHWLRNKNLGEIDRYEVSRLSLALKTAKPGSAHPVKGASKLMIETRTAGFRTTP